MLFLFFGLGLLVGIGVVLALIFLPATTPTSDVESYYAQTAIRDIEFRAIQELLNAESAVRRPSGVPWGGDIFQGSATEDPRP